MSDRYKKKRVLVIDGDILAYQIATNNERPINWGDGLWTLHAEGKATNVLTTKCKQGRQMNR